MDGHDVAGDRDAGASCCRGYTQADGTFRGVPDVETLAAALGGDGDRADGDSARSPACAGASPSKDGRSRAASSSGSAPRRSPTGSTASGYRDAVVALALAVALAVLMYLVYALFRGERF